MQINIRDLKKITLTVPPIETQNALLADLKGISDKTHYLETTYQQKLTDLTELKQSILQKAFAGELH